MYFSSSEDGFYICKTIRTVTEISHTVIVTDLRDLARALQFARAHLPDPFPRGPFQPPRPSDRIVIAQPWGDDADASPVETCCTYHGSFKSGLGRSVGANHAGTDGDSCFRPRRVDP